MSDDILKKASKEDLRVLVRGSQKEIAELKVRLEISDEHPYDGIYCRDTCIRLQDRTIDEQRADIKELAEALDEFNSLFSDDFIHDDGRWYLDANIDGFLERNEELANKHKKGE